MRLLLPLFFLLIISAALPAQDPVKSALAPCGSPVGVDPWLRTFRQQGPTVADRSSDTLYAAVQVHLLASDAGTGRFSPGRLLDALCQLNTDFTASGIRFYLQDNWNNINSTAWWKHDSIPQGIELMLTNNVADALNTYFVSDPAGNCGYNLPYAGIAVAHSCSGPSDHTWAHEIGHALSLPHPFLGWEGKTYNFDQSTPDTLTYDYTYFHDSLEAQLPVPLDTALVEKLDGSNCAAAADLICDTKSDYLSYRWNCDAQHNSLVKQRDPSGQEFYSDGTLFMSYAADACQNRFSDDQIAVMRANLQIKKAAWLDPGPPPPPIAATPVLLDPIDNVTLPNIGVQLHWAPVAGATHYIVQATRIASFAVREFELVSTDTSLTLPPLSVNTRYYWRVRPFSFWNFCAGTSPAETFMTGEITATTSPDADGWRCYPTCLAPGQEITIETPAAWLNRPAYYALYDLTGRLCWTSTNPVHQTRMRLVLPANLSGGMYCLVVRTANGVKTERLVVSTR